MRKIIYLNVAVLAAALGAGMMFSPEIFRYLLHFLPQGITIASLSPEAGINTMFMIGILTGLLAYIPFGMVSLYLYIRPALYERERMFIRNKVGLALLLFAVGAAFGMASYVFFGIPFFQWADKVLGIANYWNVASLIGQMLLAALGTGVFFLMPIVLTAGIRYGAIRVEMLRKKRLWFAGGLFLAIILLPFMPSAPLQQVVVFVPLYALYEGTIYFNRDVKPSGAVAVVGA